MADACKTAPGLARLNPAEREVLALLARGHTVKSIAALTEQTPNAVNERLRSARRKCGVGSSRELARLLDLQENWTQRNGAAGDAVEASEAQPSAHPRRKERAPFQGVLTVSLAAVTLAALAFQLAPAPATAPVPDPLIDALVGQPSPDLHALHLQAHAGVRDAAEEARLQSALSAQPKLTRGVGPLRVVCTQAVCEVSGAFLGTKIQPAMDAIQGPIFSDAVKPLGLSYVASGFGGDARRGEAAFVTYLQRPE